VVGRTKESKEKKAPKVDWKENVTIDLITYLKLRLEYLFISQLCC
jgi:hypothetical protein